MTQTRRIIVSLAIAAMLAAGCEVASETTETPDGADQPTEAEPTDGVNADDETENHGVEREVPPLPEPVAEVESDTGLRLVAHTPASDGTFLLDGATVGAAFDARLIVDDDRVVDNVVWQLGGEIFRDDDENAPYTLRYASALFPIGEWVESDQGRAGSFIAERGSTVELTAIVYSNGGRQAVTAAFAVEEIPSVVNTTPEPAAAPTTSNPVTTSTTSLPPPAEATTTSAPPTTTQPQADVADPPWVLPPGSEIAVDLPRGQLGPRTTTPVDPATVSGISFDDGIWTMNRNWDELTDGGYLDFGAAALRTNGYQILGFQIEMPSNISNGHLIDGGGEVGWFKATNPSQYTSNSYLRGDLYAHNYIALGVASDAIKVREGVAYHRDAYIQMNVVPGGPNDKHYDGAQIFQQGEARLERIVIEWADAGTIANTTGALFTQDEAALTARDILILNPGGTWQPVRLSGSGVHDLDRLQIIGERRGNNEQPTKLAPSAAVKITNGSEMFTLFNDVDGVDDWLIE